MNILSVSPAWVTAPPIIQTIFENLPSKDLNSCAQVCSVWSGIARIVKKRRRRRLSWFFFKCVKGKDVNFHVAFYKHIRNLYIEPVFTLVLGTRGSITWKLNNRTGNRKAEKNGAFPVGCSLVNSLPSTSDFLFVDSDGITGTNSDCSLTDQLEDDEGITALFFPALPGLEIRAFKLSGCGKTLNQIDIPEDKPVKCMLMFESDRPRFYNNSINAESILTHYLSKTKGKLAVGGAFIKKVNFQRQRSGIRGTNFGLAFMGDNVNAASIVISPEEKTSSDVEEKLKVLFDTDILEGQCIAFAFTCVARGEQFFGTRNVESDVFRKLFPSIPLFGVFGNGEIGVNYVPNVSESSDWNSDTPIIHTYTTIFVVISVK